MTVRAAEAIEDFTANLRAPILISEGRGHQVINQAPDAPVRAPLLRRASPTRPARPRSPTAPAPFQGGIPHMLIITRRPGEKVMLGDDVVVEVIEVSG